MSSGLSEIVKELLRNAFTVTIDGIPHLFSGVNAHQDDEGDWQIVLVSGGVEHEFAFIGASADAETKVSHAVQDLRGLCRC